MHLNNVLTIVAGIDERSGDDRSMDVLLWLLYGVAVKSEFIYSPR